MKNQQDSSKIPVVGQIYTIDLGSTPVEVKVLELRTNGVYCEYLKSWSGRKELLDYFFF